jgi:hypothetical protein
VTFRYICANRHPDHDTICTFRVRNKDGIAEAFLRILVLAKEMNILKIGTVSVDGNKIIVPSYVVRYYPGARPSAKE